MTVMDAVVSWRLPRTPAIAQLIVLNNSVLFACVSMYLGTGWSLVLFSFSIADQLTPGLWWDAAVAAVRGVLAKAGFFKVLLLGLAAFWKVIAVGGVAAIAAISSFVKRFTRRDPPTG